MLASAAHHYLFTFILQVIVPFEFFYKGILKRIDTAHRRILGETIHDGVDSSLLNVRWSVEVRFAAPKAHDVQALGPQGFFLSRNGQCCGWFQGSYSCGKHMKAPSVHVWCYNYHPSLCINEHSYLHQRRHCCQPLLRTDGRWTTVARCATGATATLGRLLPMR